jgi:hypothetical protein
MRFRKDWANACLMGYSHLCPCCGQLDAGRRFEEGRPQFWFQCVGCNATWGFDWSHSKRLPRFVEAPS